PPPPHLVALKIRNATDLKNPLRVLGIGGAQIGVVPWGTTAIITVDSRYVFVRAVVEERGREWGSDTRQIFDSTHTAPTDYVVYRRGGAHYPNLLLLPEGTPEPAEARAEKHAEDQEAIRKQQAKIPAVVFVVLAVLGIAIAVTAGIGGYQDVRDANTGDCVSVSKADSSSWHKVECWWQANWNGQAAVYKVVRVYTAVDYSTYVCGSLAHAFITAKNSSAVYLLCLNEINAG
ncbi:hypothetical protein, partial [Catenulispora rubra]|uniref:hypothetical protein n=1 Tax=Catenulispora rubra TaxID=280293 RepID=UPI001E4734ED